MLRYLTNALLVAIFSCLTLSAHSRMAFAEPSQIVIKDTGGVTRAVSEVDVAGNIEFKVSDETGAPSTGSEVTLKNEETGETFTAISANGVVLFEGIAPGVWTVASSSASITFLSVNISAATAVASAGLGGTTVLGMSVPVAVGAGAGGSALIAGASVAIANAQDSNDSPPLSPSN